LNAQGFVAEYLKAKGSAKIAEKNTGKGDDLTAAMDWALVKPENSENFTLASRVRIGLL
jgi:hypothetical protein